MKKKTTPRASLDTNWIQIDLSDQTKVGLVEVAGAEEEGQGRGGAEEKVRY